MRDPRVVVVGGGTGTFIVLVGLKKYDLGLSAIITMMDSGGSTGRLRDQYGALPPGDIRQALVALSESDKIWRELFLYRFNNGDFTGHNFGNIFLTVLEKITESFEKALLLAEQILQTKGNIIPITLENTHIIAELTDNTLIKTEALIDKQEKRAPIKKLFLEKKVKVNSKALNAIHEADYIIISPGDLYTSIIPNFMFKEIVQAYHKSKAKKIFVLNLMNKLGQTDNFKASDYIKHYSRILGDNPFDYILINKTKIPETMKKLYEKYGESDVINDLIEQNYKFKLIEADILNKQIYQKNKGDKLTRSLVRHDPEKLAKLIWENIILHK